MTSREKLLARIERLKKALARWQRQGGKPRGVLPGRVFWRPEVERWRSLVAYYFKSEDVDIAMALIRCESLGDPTREGPSIPVTAGSSDTMRAAGLFQHLPKYWPDRARAIGMPDASPFDPVANIKAAALLRYAPGGGWKHWSCYEWAKERVEKEQGE